MIASTPSGSVPQPDKVLFADLSITTASGDRIAMIGLNGSGKSTLLRVLTAAAPPDYGTVRFARDLRVANLEQDPQLPPGTVAAYLGGSWEVAAVAPRSACNRCSRLMFHRSRSRHHRGRLPFSQPR